MFRSEILIVVDCNYYKNSYQITIPTYVKPLEQIDEITKIFPKYSLTEGLLEKNYRKLITNIVEKIDDNFEWHENEFLQKKHLIINFVFKFNTEKINSNYIYR